MRVLFSCLVGYGVFQPMVPLARALGAAGHDVVFASGDKFCSWIEHVGFTAIPVGIGGATLVEETRRRFPEESDPEPDASLDYYLTTMCARVAAPARAHHLVPLVQRLAPDVVVHDLSEFAAPLAAAAAGVPNAAHGWAPCFPAQAFNRAADALAPLWKEWGLEPQPLGGVFRHLYLDVYPPSVQPRDPPHLAVAEPLRVEPVHLPLDGGPLPSGLPPWFDALEARPVVYVTLGTVVDRNHSVLEAVLNALGDEPIDVVVTVGREQDPAVLDMPAENVYIAPYLPQSLLLPRCDLVVCHAGAGITLAALGEGLPLLLLPQGIDQFFNADLCVGAGAARSLVGAAASAPAIRAAVHELLATPGYRRRAAEVAAEIEAMPAPERVVATLEELARTTRPRRRAQ